MALPEREHDEAVVAGADRVGVLERKVDEAVPGPTANASSASPSAWYETPVPERT